MELIDALDLVDWLEDEEQPKPVLLDVRENSEVELCQIPGSIHMAMNSVPERLNDLKKEVPIVCICHHGSRSMKVAQFLKQHGFEKVINLIGGIHAWSVHVDPSMPKY